MKRLILAFLIPFSLLAAGTAALIYAAAGRTVPVVAEILVEKETIVLEPPPPSIWPGPAGPGDRRPRLPRPPPRPRKVKTTVAAEQVQPTRESQVIREVTVGGITRLADGRLKLTYRPGEAGPALCPT